MDWMSGMNMEKLPFFNVCRQKRKDIIKLFIHLDKEIDFNARMDYYNECTAFIFAWSNGSTDVVELLLAHSDGKVDLDAKDEYGCTAFMEACTNGHKDIVQLMMDSEKNIDLNATDKDGNTALMLAFANRNYGVVTLLINHFGKRIKIQHV